MFFLITYDVNITSEGGAKRLRKVARECMNYGKRVQNSVFECMLTQTQYVMLRNLLLRIIDVDNDSIRMYNLGSNWDRRIEVLGRETGIDFAGDLII